MNFLQLLKRIEKDLKKTNSQIEKNYLFLKYEIDCPSLINLYLQLSLFPKSYFHPKNSEDAILGIGAIEIIEGQDNTQTQQKLKKMFDQLPHASLLGGESFFSDSISQKCESEWDEFGQSYFFLPRLLISKKGNEQKTEIFFNIKNSEDDFYKALLFLKNIRDNQSDHIEKQFKISSKQNSDFQSWSQQIEMAINEIKQKKFHKVVLARKIIKNCHSENTIKSILEGWSESITEHYHFILQTHPKHAFLSISPERLFKVENRRLEIDAIAGSKPRGQTPEQDLVLENELRVDKKEIEEHNYVSHDIQKKLEKICLNVTKKKTHEILKLKNIQHLYGQFCGELSQENSFRHLIQYFHPTPAVGGHPKPLALKFIKEKETFQRGLYAAPIGQIKKDSCDFAVGIRSALIHNDQIHIFGGCGIVKDSIALNEWNETENKMKNFTDQL